MPPITIHPLPWTHPDATTLREAQQQEIDSLRPRGLGIAASAANVPVFLVAYIGTEAVGCGGLRPLSNVGLPGQAEIKRMYVVPSRRALQEKSSGGSIRVAEVILEALEKIAVEQGWMTLKAETSLKMMQARRFYEKYGYEDCGLYGAYKDSTDGRLTICYEKRLG